MQNRLRNGWSVDSAKRQHGATGFGTDLESWTAEILAEAGTDDSVLDWICAREVYAMIARWLTPMERRILDGLAAGSSVRQVVRRLGLSHTAVIKHRRRMAAVAVKLGNEPTTNGKIRLKE